MSFIHYFTLPNSLTVNQLTYFKVKSESKDANGKPTACTVTYHDYVRQFLNAHYTVNF